MSDNPMFLSLIRESTEVIQSVLTELDRFDANKNWMHLSSASTLLDLVTIRMNHLEEACDDSLEIFPRGTLRCLADAVSRSRTRVHEAQDDINVIVRDIDADRPGHLLRARSRLSTTLAALDEVHGLLMARLIEVYFIPFAR